MRCGPLNSSRSAQGRSPSAPSYLNPKGKLRPPVLRPRITPGVLLSGGSSESVVRQLQLSSDHGAKSVPVPQVLEKQRGPEGGCGPIRGKLARSLQSSGAEFCTVVSARASEFLGVVPILRRVLSTLLQLVGLGRAIGGGSGPFQPLLPLLLLLALLFQILLALGKLIVGSCHRASPRSRVKHSLPPHSGGTSARAMLQDSPDQ